MSEAATQETTNSTEENMKTKVKIIIAAALATAAGSAAWSLTRNSAGAPPVVLYGNVDIREVDLAFRQGGRLERMAFEEGDFVPAGTVLAELDSGPYCDALAAATAEVAAARAELEKLQ